MCVRSGFWLNTLIYACDQQRVVCGIRSHPCKAHAVVICQANCSRGFVAVNLNRGTHAGDDQKEVFCFIKCLVILKMHSLT